ncbi:MAG: hypothetical protein JXQ72_11855 [Anaerolineae bacterium]|nr:hypothetical protein [Anaerolineae bacterium]
MEQPTDNQIHRFQCFLQIYHNEPLGYILVRRLRLPLAVIGFGFIFLYFGILLILHHLAGHASPATLEDVLRIPPASHYYYPNLNAIVYDIIGNPLLLLLLIFFGQYVPKQIRRLEQSNLIQPGSSPSRPIRWLINHEAGKRWLVGICLVVTLGVAVITTVIGVVMSPPANTPDYYVVFLSFLGHYGQITIFVQLIILLIILNDYKLTPRLHLRHPDGCSGLAPFGQVGLVVYLYLFILALQAAIGTIAGGTPLQRLTEQTINASAWIFLSIFFSTGFFLVFHEFLYKPRRALKTLQQQYLLKAGDEWTRYHQRLSASIIDSVEESASLLSGRSEFQFDDDLKLLEIWDKLNRDVEHINTWPISRRTIRSLAFFANPLFPVLLPFIAEAISNIIS